MSTSMININGEVRDVTGLTLPTDRRFRSAWAVNGDVIEVDATLAAPIWRELVNEERDARLLEPASITITGSSKRKTGEDENGDDTLEDVVDATFGMDMRDERDRANLLGLTLTANLRVGAGDLVTLTPIYTAEDEEYHLTPLQVISLGQQAGSHDGKLYAKARKIKAMDPIPADYATNEAYWTD